MCQKPSQRRTTDAYSCLRPFHWRARLTYTTFSDPPRDELHNYEPTASRVVSTLRVLRQRDTHRGFLRRGFLVSASRTCLYRITNLSATDGAKIDNEPYGGRRRRRRWRWRSRPLTQRACTRNHPAPARRRRRRQSVSEPINASPCERK